MLCHQKLQKEEREKNIGASGHCAKCGKELTYLARGLKVKTMCMTCEAKLNSKQQEEFNKNSALQGKQNREEIETVILTTEAYPQGMKITKRIEIVTAECAFGMNIFKDLFAGVRDIVGGRSEAVQKTLRGSRRTALYELKKEAHAVGANAVIGVDLDYVELSSSGSMVLLVASGTAVVIEDT